jgi:hypothetical protein
MTKDAGRTTKHARFRGIEVGERVRVRAYKSDETCYRWWWATVEAVEEERVVLVTPAGHQVEDWGGGCLGCKGMPAR